MTKLVVILVFVTFILFDYSSHLSFAITNNEKEEDDKKYSKDIFDLSINENETSNDNLKESYIHINTNTLNDNYQD